MTKVMLARVVEYKGRVTPSDLAYTSIAEVEVATILVEDAEADWKLPNLVQDGCYVMVPYEDWVQNHGAIQQRRAAIEIPIGHPETGQKILELIVEGPTGRVLLEKLAEADE